MQDPSPVNASLVSKLRVVLLLFAAILAFSCTKDNAVQPVSTEDKPGVVLTYPANGAIGPFDIYAGPSSNVRLAHFYVQFRMPMNMSTFTPGTVKCEGFGKPVDVLPLNNYYYLSSGISDVVGFQIVPQRQEYPPLQYKINVTYTISIDSTAKAFNGERLGSRFEFSFTPEPYFRVTGFNFWDGDVLPSGLPLEVHFNSKISLKDLGAITFDPPLRGNWGYLNGDSSVASYYDYDLTKIGESHTIIIPQTLEDIDGNKLKEGVGRSFHTQPFALRYTYPDVWDASINLSTGLGFNFNFDFDTASARASWTVNPPTPMVVAISASNVTLSPISDFLPDVDYAVGFSTALKTVGGVHLGKPIDIRFHTPKFQCFHTPSAGEVNVPLTTGVYFNFSGSLDSSTIASGISISPSFPGTLKFGRSWLGRITSIYYNQDGAHPLPPNTTYKVVVSSALRSFGGFHLAQPDSFTFTTIGLAKKSP